MAHSAVEPGVLRRGQRPFLFQVAFPFVLQWSTASCLSLGNDQNNVRGTAVKHHSRSDSSADVYYVTGMADRFTNFATRHRGTVDQFHLSEQDRLQAAIRDANTAGDKALLELTATSNEENRLEAENAFDEMMTFVTTLKQAMGAKGSATSCLDLTCGPHAFCDAGKDLAQCRCQDGYEGNGFVCNPPTRFVEHPLIQFAVNTPAPQVADLHVATLRGQHIAVAYRDLSKSNKGYFMVGTVGAAIITWTPPILFSNLSQAFGPVLVELQDSPGIAIAFRDQNRGGSGILLGGEFDLSKKLVTLGPLRAFARYQAQGLSMLALPRSRVAVIFAEHSLQKSGGTAMYGSAALARVHIDGKPPELIGKRRFAVGPVARIATSMLSPTSFVVAFRQGPGLPNSEKMEASCAFAQLSGDDLVFDARPLLLEPEQTQIWARSVALLQDGIIAYTYHSGKEQLTKQAILRVDPSTHQVSMLKKPEVIGEGFSPYAGTVSTSTPLAEHQASEQLQLLQEQGPRLFTYFSSGGSTKPQAKMCKVHEGLPIGCQNVTWSEHEIASVAGTPVGDGRIILVSTDARGSPCYQLIGLMEPD